MNKFGVSSRSKTPWGCRSRQTTWSTPSCITPLKNNCIYHFKSIFTIKKQGALRLNHRTPRDIFATVWLFNRTSGLLPLWGQSRSLIGCHPTMETFRAFYLIHWHGFTTNLTTGVSYPQLSPLLRGPVDALERPTSVFL